MISAPDLIEKILARSTTDDCIVIVQDKTQANLRWANNTLTTNGVIQERRVTVLAFISTNDSMAAGGVSRTNVNESEIDEPKDGATTMKKRAAEKLAAKSAPAETQAAEATPVQAEVAEEVSNAVVAETAASVEAPAEAPAEAPTETPAE